MTRHCWRTGKALGKRERVSDRITFILLLRHLEPLLISSEIQSMRTDGFKHHLEGSHVNYEILGT